jgi:ATP-dependent helicase/nuclease subunit A
LEEKSASPSGPVDKRARELASWDLSRNYWVEAGAGTGKTTLLVERLLRIIASGAARLEEIVAITFTEKAATELKVRLQEKIKERLQAAPPEQQPRLRQALEEIEYAPIATIHSFAGSLLRERPVEAAVDPAFKVLDPGEMEDFLDRVWERWFAEELKRAPRLLRQALRCGFAPEHFRQLGRLLYDQRDLVEEGSSPDPPDLVPLFLEELAAALPELEGLLDCCTNHRDRGYLLLLELIREGRALLGTPHRWEQDFLLVTAFPSISPCGNQSNWKTKDDCARQKEICSRLKQLQEQARQSIIGTLMAELIRWCKNFLQAVEAAKEEKGVLDFQDLLLKARNLLRDHLPVREYFQQRFRFILVDEFQDTDPLQVELVFFLAEESPRARSWQEAVPAAGKLFLVGDPKQSIYRFRRADIEIYQEAGERLREHGELLAITQNFRTVPGLIDWVNLVFERLIQPRERYQPAYIPLHAYRPSWEEPALVLLDPPPEQQGSRAAQVREAEARAVADFIQEITGRWPVHDRRGEVRPVRYGDLAVLFLTTTGIEVYEREFRKRGIPYRLEGGKRFFFREEINALRNFLVSLSNPYDRVALVAVLRYWGGISDEELFRYCEEGGVLNYLAPVEDRYPAIKRTFQLLQDLYRRQHQLSLAGLVEELLQRTRFYQRVSLQEQGQQAASNLRKLLGMIRSREQERPLTLTGLSRWLIRVEKQEREEAESLLYESDSDAVQVMTIHKAKGLEFPVVFLANLGTTGSHSENFLADRSRRRFEIRLGGNFFTAGYPAALEQEKRRREAERLRLMYVAATRARDYLVIPRFYNPARPGFFWEKVKGLEEEGVELTRGRVLVREAKGGPWPGEGEGRKTAFAGKEGERGAASRQLEALLARREAWSQELRRLLAEASRPGPYFSFSRLAAEDEDRLSLEGAELEPDLRLPGAGVAFGSAFHQVMEQVDFMPTEDRLRELVSRAAEQWYIADRAELERLVKRTLEHPLLLRAREAEGAWREVPFVLNLQGKLVEGMIDLVFQEGDGLVIVDYKTDRGDDEAVSRRWPRYELQGRIYALALTEASGLPVQEVSFLFVRSGLVKKVPLSNLQCLARQLCQLY